MASFQKHRLNTSNFKDRSPRVTIKSKKIWKLGISIDFNSLSISDEGINPYIFD